MDRAKKLDKFGNAGTMYRAFMDQSLLIVHLHGFGVGIIHCGDDVALFREY